MQPVCLVYRDSLVSSSEVKASFPSNNYLHFHVFLCSALFFIDYLPFLYVLPRYLYLNFEALCCQQCLLRKHILCDSLRILYAVAGIISSCISSICCAPIILHIVHLLRSHHLAYRQFVVILSYCISSTSQDSYHRLLIYAFLYIFRHHLD